jgi:hypothetical protein
MVIPSTTVVMVMMSIGAWSFVEGSREVGSKVRTGQRSDETIKLLLSCVDSERYFLSSRKAAAL